VNLRPADAELVAALAARVARLEQRVAEQGAALSRAWQRLELRGSLADVWRGLERAAPAPEPAAPAPWLGTRAAARLLKCSPRNLQELAARGALGAIDARRPGARRPRWRWPVAALEREVLARSAGERGIAKAGRLKRGENRREQRQRGDAE
jgi:hypothetical protein